MTMYRRTITIPLSLRFMKTSALLLSTFVLFSVPGWAQPERLHQIHQNIQSVFYEPTTGLYKETNDAAHNEKPHSYLWPLCALVQAANEMEVLEPKASYLKPVLQTIQQYYNPNPPAPGYQAYVKKEMTDTRFYDDNQWIAIACLDAYERTKQPSYLDTAELIYKFMLTGYDQQATGGIYWKEDDKTTKNTCSNGPGILIALQLYKLKKNPKDLQTALDLYRWTKKQLQAPSGVYYDAVKLPSMKIDSAIYTYNTGTMLQSSVLLYQLTKEKSYLKEAKRVAEAAKKHFYRNNRFPENYWFNVVLLRGYIELFEVDKDPQYLRLFARDAERIWKEEKDQQQLIGPRKWKSLIDQAAMLEMYARLEALKGKI